MLTSYILHPKNSISNKIFISCHIITILYPFTSSILYIISIFGNYLHIVSKTISPGMNISKRRLFDKTPCFLWQKPYNIVLKTMLYRGYVYIFLHIVNSCKCTRCSTHTPRSKFEIPSSISSFPPHLTPHKKIAKIHKMSSRTSSRKSL